MQGRRFLTGQISHLSDILKIFYLVETRMTAKSCQDKMWRWLRYRAMSACRCLWVITIHLLSVPEQTCLLRVYTLLICLTRYYESNSTRMEFLKQLGNVFQLTYVASHKMFILNASSLKAYLIGFPISV